MGDVNRFRLSPNESRLTRLLRVTLLWDPTGACSSPAGNTGLSLGLRPFQSTDLCEDVNEENGQPRFSSVVSKLQSLASRPGLSSPQSEPTELLNDSEEIFRDDEDMVAVVRERSKVVMIKVVRRMMMVMLQLVAYHVHLYAGESSDSWEVGDKRRVVWIDGGTRKVRWVTSYKASPCDMSACDICVYDIMHSSICVYVWDVWLWDLATYS